MAEKPVPDWLKPLWVRIAFTVLPGAWALFELTNGQFIWAALFGAASVWGLWSLLIKFDPDGTIR